MPERLRHWMSGRVEDDARRCAEPMLTYLHCVHYHQAWLTARRCFHIGRNPAQAQTNALQATTEFRAFLVSNGHHPDAIEAWLTKYRQEHPTLERQYWAFVATVAACRQAQQSEAEDAVRFP